MTKTSTNTAGGFGGWLATLQSAFEAFPAAGSLTEADIKAASPQELVTACAFLHAVLNDAAEAVKAIGDHATCGVALWAQAMVSDGCGCCGEEGFDDGYDDEEDESAAGDNDEKDLDEDSEAELSDEEEEAIRREAERFAFASIAGIMTPEGAAAFSARMHKRC